MRCSTASRRVHARPREIRRIAQLFRRLGKPFSNKHRLGSRKSFLLATKFKGRQWTIILGILGATAANHFVAAFLGDWVAANVSPNVMRWILGLAFLGFAIWADSGPARRRRQAKPLRPFPDHVDCILPGGDGRQDAVRHDRAGREARQPRPVTGTTLGMMAANIPAVLLGERLARYIPLSRMRFIAAAPARGR